MTLLQKTIQRITEAPVIRAALATRVSTTRQAQNEEGSLKNQLQRLRQHIEYKRNACGENWVEAGVYELKGISGKNSMRSREFERLFAEIRAGRVNMVFCTELSRICRSVKDFLWFFEFLQENGAQFVCLKQNYDTTSAQGRLFVTMMMALAEFEREQTSERTRDAIAARAERGLWNGGRLIGYDADPNRKSTLIPNPQEVAIVNFAFDKYLECGSIVDTTEAMNRRGYRTKSYTSRQDIFHPGERFYNSTVQYLLKNPAYVGKKEINKKNRYQKNCALGKEYRVVDAAWPPIVSLEKFEAVQGLMKENGQTNRNAAEPVRHAYVLSRGILHCGRCGAVMDGRCGTGRLGTKYFYYACRKECGLRVSADEVEMAVLERIKHLASTEAVLQRITEETNARLKRQKPELEKQRQCLIKNLSEIKNKADQLLEHWSGLQGQAGTEFVKDKLSELARRRTDLEHGISETEAAILQIKNQSVDVQKVRLALARIDEVYTLLLPFERRELMSLVLKSARVNEREINLEIFALGEVQQASLRSVNPGEKVRLPPNWLPR